MSVGIHPWAGITHEVRKVVCRVTVLTVGFFVSGVVNQHYPRRSQTMLVGISMCQKGQRWVLMMGPGGG